MDGKILLDTCAVIDLFKNLPWAVKGYSAATEVFMPYIVEAELLYAVYNSKFNDKNMARLQTFLKEITLIYGDSDTSEIYARYKAELKRIGKPIPDNDLWIAALAGQHNLPVLTIDAHLTHVSEIKTIGL